MSERTRIEWCDSTASPWTGCTPVSAGCDHCYARTLAKRHGWSQEWGKGAARHRFGGFEKAALAMERKAAAGLFVSCTVCGVREFRKRDPRFPETRMEACGGCGVTAVPNVNAMPCRPRVFPSLCDWLDPEVPVAWLADLLDVIRRTPHLDWLLLTKRPGMWKERMNKAMTHALIGRFASREMPSLYGWIGYWIDGTTPANVWIGTTCENQAAADLRVPELLRIPAAVRFVSVEPMLAALRFAALDWIDWVICGGESGPKARPMHPDWARSLRDQCEAAGVPFLFKQWGEFTPCWVLSGGFWPVSDMPQMGAMIASGQIIGDQVPQMLRVGKARAGRLLDGREWNEMPLARCAR